MVDSSPITEFIAPSKQLFDQSYLNSDKQLRLHIQLSKNHFTSAHFDVSKKKYISLEEYPLGNHESWFLMQQNAAKFFELCTTKNNAHIISLALVDHLYTLVPLAFFDENKISSYLDFNHQIENQEQLHYQFDIIESQQTAIVYALPKSLYTLMESTFNKLNWSHFAYPLLESILIQNNSEPILHLHMQHNRFDAIYIEDNQLKFFNSFNYKTDEDLLYYLLFVMEQLKLNPESTLVQVVGEFDEISSIYKLLYQYIRNIRIGQRPQELNYSQVLSSIPAHHYNNLFNQYLCE